MSATPRASACRPRRLSTWTWALLLASLVFGAVIGRGEGQQGAETNALEALDRYLEGCGTLVTPPPLPPLSATRTHARRRARQHLGSGAVPRSTPPGSTIRG